MPGNLNGYVGDDVAIFFCGVRQTRRRRVWLSNAPVQLRSITTANHDSQPVQ